MKRKLANHLVEENQYAVNTVCEFLDLSKSSYYYQQKTEKDQKLEADLREVAGKHPTYGTRRLTHQLRREPYGYQVNRKRIQRLARVFDLLRIKKPRKTSTTNSKHPYPRYENLVSELNIDHPDHVWVSDITYIRLHQDFVYLAVIMDVFTRAIRGWCLSQSIDQQLTLEALKMALENHTPQIHHSDQGVQYACTAYVNLLQSLHVQISMAAVGKAEENGYAERLMRTIKEEEVDLSEYRDFTDANFQIGHFIQDVYMTKRIHSSLGYLTPLEFETAYWVSHNSFVLETSPF